MFRIFAPRMSHPFTHNHKPDTFDLAKPTDIMAFAQHAGQNEQVVVFPKDYKPLPKQTVYEKSPFAKHELKTKSLLPMDKIPGEGWVFIALVAIFILLMWLRRINAKKMWVYLSAFYNRRALNELFDEENLLSSPFSLILFLAFCLTGGLFITKAIGVVGGAPHIDFTDYRAFGIFTGGLLVIYAAKIIFIQLIGYIFRIYPLARQYAFNVYLLNNILGLMLIPVVAIAYYTGAPADVWATYTGIALFALFFLLRFAKAFTIDGVAAPLNLLYLFLYLCTLEILPLVVAIKVVNSL